MCDERVYFFSISEEAPYLCAAIRSAEDNEDQHRCRITVCLKPDGEQDELQMGDHFSTDEEDAGVYPISYALHQGVDNVMGSNFQMCDPGNMPLRLILARPPATKRQWTKGTLVSILSECITPDAF